MESRNASDERPSKPSLLYVQKHIPLRQYSHSEVFEFVIVLLRHILGVCALAFRRRVVVIIITCVSRVFELWNDRAFDPSVIQCIPVDGFEERVRLHKSGAADTTTGNIAKPLRWIDGTETTNEVTGIG